MSFRVAGVVGLLVSICSIRFVYLHCSRRRDSVSLLHLSPHSHLDQLPTQPPTSPSLPLPPLSSYLPFPTHPNSSYIRTKTALFNCITCLRSVTMYRSRHIQWSLQNNFHQLLPIHNIATVTAYHHTTLHLDVAIHQCSETSIHSANAIRFHVRLY